MQIGVSAKEYGPNPHTRICHICGRQFGSQSIAIHQKKCAEKWHQNQAHLPRSQRHPLPPEPVNVGPKSSKTDNDIAFETYLEHARKECPNCARKFAIDRLDVHLKSCSPGGFFARKNQERIDKGPQKETSVDSGLNISNPQIAPRAKDQISQVKRTPPTTKALYCTGCGSAFCQNSDRFCNKCGKKRN